MIDNEKQELEEQNYYEQIIDEHEQAEAQKRKASATLDTGCLPAAVRSYIQNLTECYGCPEEFVTAAVLTAGATALGERFYLDACGHINYPVLWMMIVAPSGSNKSAPAKRVFTHLLNCNLKLEREWLSAHAAEKEKGKDKDAEAAEKKFYDRPKRMIISDVTPEAMNLNLLNNQSGMLMYRDEARGFFDDLTRYGGTGAITDLLSIYDTTPVTNDRVGSRPYTISLPLLNFYGTTQPAIVNEFLSGKKFCDSGFNQRLLFIVPDKVPIPVLHDASPSPSLQLKWDALLQSCLDTYPHRYTLSPEAFEVYSDFHTNMGMFQSETDEEYLLAVYSKLRIQVLRLALVIQGLNDVAADCDKRVVNAEAMQAASHWCTDYFLPKAFIMYKRLSEPEARQVSLKEAIRFVYDRNPHTTIMQIAALLDVSYSYVRRIVRG